MKDGTRGITKYSVIPKLHHQPKSSLPSSWWGWRCLPDNEDEHEDDDKPPREPGRSAQSTLIPPKQLPRFIPLLLSQFRLSPPTQFVQFCSLPPTRQHFITSSSSPLLEESFRATHSGPSTGTETISSPFISALLVPLGAPYACICPLGAT